ncbi:hypothetical protein D1AOALGA4SA_4963 [Olavius algarvensis Delta 1 endosymbiont]|nr:hypothetical protein D1AOALGA4SA_4963 [Olavius algarvensis Delta 1 endosymbiont]
MKHQIGAVSFFDLSGRFLTSPSCNREYPTPEHCYTKWFNLS